MALTVLHTPEELALVKNIVHFQLQTDELITTPGVKCMRTFLFSAFPNIGDTFTFDWPGHSVTFTVDVAAIHDGFHIQTGGSLTLAEWVQQRFMDEGVRGNYDLNEDFEFAVDPGDPTSVIVTARKAGTAYELTFSYASAAIVLGLGDVNSVDQVKEPGFKIYADIYLEQDFGSGIYSRIAAMQGIPADDGTHTFFMQRYMRAYLGSDLPGFNQNTWSNCANILKNYFLRYAEYYGDPASVKYLEGGAQDAKQILYAGLDYTQFPDNTFYEDYIHNADVAVRRKFLTQQPRTKIISPQQQEYLYHYINLDGATAYLNAKLYYTDGSEQTVQPSASGTGLKRVQIIPAGYGQLNLATFQPSKTIYKYELWISYSTTAELSEVFTYELDHTVYPNSYYLLYLNSLGGFDTLWCNGEIEKSAKAENEEAEKVILAGYTATERQTVQFNTESRWKISLSTGWKSREYIEALQDFILSEEIYLVMDDRFVPVQLEKKDLLLYNTQSNVNELEVSIQPAYKNETYSA